MNNLKTYWGFNFKGAPNEYDDVMKSKGFKGTLLYKIIQL